MKKYITIIKLALPLMFAQLILTGCPKKPYPSHLLKYSCDKYEMVSDSNGEIYEVVSDTIIYINYAGNTASVLEDVITFDPYWEYSGYHTICDNSSFYFLATNGGSNISVAYEIPMGDSTYHATLIGKAID
jgi:hypothetical protein